MDRIVVGRKLDSLRRCLQRIQDKRPESVAALQADADLQDVLVLNLTRAVQLCVDLASHLIVELDLPPPQTMAQSFEILARSGTLSEDLALRLRKSVGFRNLAVHAYEAIDWAIVLAICSRHLQDFEDYARIVAQTAEARGTSDR